VDGHVQSQITLKSFTVYVDQATALEGKLVDIGAMESG